MTESYRDAMSLMIQGANRQPRWAFTTLFCFRGSISRSTFWRLFIVVSAIAVASMFLPSLLVHLISISSNFAFPDFIYNAYYIWGISIAAFYAVSLLSIMARRLHDLGFRGWLLIIIIFPLILPAPAGEFDFMRWWPDIFLGPRLLPTLATIGLVGLFIVVGLFPRHMEFTLRTMLRSIVYCSLILLTLIQLYNIFNFIGIIDAKASSATERIEDIIASIGNRDGSQVSKELSTTFSNTLTIMGVVELARRTSDGRLELGGWAVDLSELEKPVLVFVIVPEKVALMTSTGQKRDDIAEWFGFPKDPSGAGFSEVFDYPFDCSDAERGPLVLAINQKRQYSLINPLLKVGGC